MPFLCSSSRHAFQDNDRQSRRHSLNEKHINRSPRRRTYDGPGRSTTALAKRRVYSKAQISGPSNFEHLSSGAQLQTARHDRDRWQAAFQNPRPIQHPNISSTRPDQVPSLPPTASPVTSADDPKVNIKRKAAPLVTPSVIRSVASPYDQRQLGSEPKPVPQSLKHLYATADEQGRHNSTLQPTPSLVDLMKTAARAEGVQEVDGKPDQLQAPSQSDSLLPPPIVQQGETTIKFNAALAKLTEALKNEALYSSHQPPTMTSAHNQKVDEIKQTKVAISDRDPSESEIKSGTMLGGTAEHLGQQDASDHPAKGQIAGEAVSGDNSETSWSKYSGADRADESNPRDGPREAQAHEQTGQASGRPSASEVPADAA